MNTSYSHLRQHLKQTIDWTIENHEPAFITSRQERKAVLMSYEDYCALEETAYLLKSPANAKRLLKAIYELETHKNNHKHGLLDDE